MPPERSHLTDRERAVDDWLREKGSVCQFAPAAANFNQLMYCTVPFEEEVYWDIRSRVAEFFKRNVRKIIHPSYKGGLILLDEVKFQNQLLQHDRIHQVREELVLAMWRHTWWQKLQRYGKMREKVKRVLGSKEWGVVGPKARGYTSVMFGMGPGYPNWHRRFAPEQLLILTVREDAEKFSKEYPELRAETLNESDRRHNDMFSTEELRFYESLDLPPEIRDKNGES